MEIDPPPSLMAKVRRLARLRTLLAQARRLDRREKYRLYMSMMGADPAWIEGEDWAFILHKLVAGSHNVAAFEKEATRLEQELRGEAALAGDDPARWHKRALETEPTFLDPVLDLVHRKIAAFYAYAGDPARGMSAQRPEP
ncbi:MAG: hypothetical protein HQK87_00360 [Nitrospinae bacterium]|nr:hypothetical protein [Nitrospinota bacterium]